MMFLNICGMLIAMPPKSFGLPKDDDFLTTYILACSERLAWHVVLPAALSSSTGRGDATHEFQAPMVGGSVAAQKTRVPTRCSCFRKPFISAIGSHAGR